MYIGKRRKHWAKHDYKIPIKFYDCKHVSRLQLKEAQKDPLVDL